VQDELREITLLRFGVPVETQEWEVQCRHRREATETSDSASIRENRFKPRKAVHPTQG